MAETPQNPSQTRGLLIRPHFVPRWTAWRLLYLTQLMDRDLQQISGDTTSRVGHYSMEEINVFEDMDGFFLKFDDTEIPPMEEALMSISRSLKWVIIDAKVGPSLYENGLAKDILSAINKIDCKNCLVWAKSDNLVREIIRLSPNATVGYIVMKDPTTWLRTNIFRVRGADVVGVYHPLIDEKLVRILQGRRKKVYAWTVDDLDSMESILHQHVDAIVANNPRASSTAYAGYANAVSGGWISAVSYNLNQRTSIARHSSNGSWDGGLPDFRIVRYDY